MKLTSLVDALIASGGTMEQVRAVVAAAEAEAARAEEERLEKKRAGNAERQRRSRASRSVTPVTRDPSPPPSPSPEPPTPPAPTPTRDPHQPAAGAPKGAASSRGSRISADWKLDDLGRAYAVSLGLTPGEVDHEAAKFLDFWLAKAGADGRKVDWIATWRTWARGALERRGRSNRPRAGPQSSPDFRNGFFQAAADDRRS